METDQQTISNHQNRSTDNIKPSKQINRQYQPSKQIKGQYQTIKTDQ